MNDEPDRGAAGFHGVEDLVEGHDDMLELAQVKLEREIRARHFARDRDQLPAQPFPQLVRRAAVGAAGSVATSIGP